MEQARHVAQHAAFVQLEKSSRICRQHIGNLQLRTPPLLIQGCYTQCAHHELQ
jgi:hypothetical protein